MESYHLKRMDLRFLPYVLKSLNGEPGDEI